METGVAEAEEPNRHHQRPLIFPPFSTPLTPVTVTVSTRNPPAATKLHPSDTTSFRSTLRPQALAAVPQTAYLMTDTKPRPIASFPGSQPAPKIAVFGIPTAAFGMCSTAASFSVRGDEIKCIGP